MSFNIEVQGGKSYLLPTGGKYCPEDIALTAIGGQTEGMFCWAKKDPNILVAESIGYANASTSLKITASDDSYTIATTSAGGWGYNYINTDIIDTTQKPLRVTYKAKLSGQNMFLGFADSQATKYDAMNESLYLTSAGAVNHQRKGAQIAGYGSWTLNDEFVMEIYKGYFTVFKNGAQLFKTATALTNACFVADLYAANAAYGDFTFESEAPKVVGYVLSDNLNAYPQDGYHTDGYYYKLMENDIAWDERGQYAWTKMESADTAPMGYVVTNTEDAYPNDGFADDGYYYTKVSATKITPKRANGTVTQSDKLIEINGLNFKPFAAFVFCPSINNGTLGCNSWGYIDENGKIYGYYMRGGYKGSSSLEVMDNGFKILASDTMGSGTYYWHAIGY